MRSRPDTAVGWPITARLRARVLVLLAALAGGMLAWQIWEDDPGLPVLVLMLPVIVVAIERGLRAGLIAAAVALAVDIVWSVVDGTHVDALWILSHGAAFTLVAAIVGYLAESLTTASTRLDAVFNTMLDPFFVYRAERDDAGAIVDFRCEYVNGAGSALLPAGTGRSDRLSEAIPGYRDRPAFARHRRVVESGEPFEVSERFGDRVLETRAVRLGDGFAAASRDVTSHARIEERLRETGAELERSNAALAEFAHVVSHELTEPLATAALFADTIDVYRARGLDPEQLLEQLRATLAVAQERIRAVLSLAEVRVGPGRAESVACGPLVDEVVGALKGLVVATGARVTVGHLPVVRGDGEQLALVFENLLTNAMRFRRDGEQPEISVTARRDEHAGAWDFAVRDGGCGVAPEDATRIFDLFARAAGQTRPGTGIGLAVCRTVVEGHGGRIWVESQPGAGSTFHFTLP
jgi:signal transduction histidine kinase